MMRNSMMTVAALLLAFHSLPSAATGDAQTPSERILVTETIVQATPADVWKAWTTADGWKSWAAPNAWFDDWKVGAMIETSYRPEAQRGDPSNIRQRVLAYLPGRLIAFQTVGTPPGFQHADLLATIVNVVEIEAVSERETRVRLSMVGYGQGPSYDALWNFFEPGNAYSLEQLRKRFSTSAEPG